MASAIATWNLPTASPSFQVALATASPSSSAFCGSPSFQVAPATASPSSNCRPVLRRARRRVVYEEEEEEEEEEFGYNEEIALLETYTRSIQNEVLLVHAMVDDQQVEVVIFKDKFRSFQKRDSKQSNHQNYRSTQGPF